MAIYRRGAEGAQWWKLAPPGVLDCIGLVFTISALAWAWWAWP
jgi:hypothetical protein